MGCKSRRKRLRNRRKRKRDRLKQDRIEAARRGVSILVLRQERRLGSVRDHERAQGDRVRSKEEEERARNSWSIYGYR